MADLNEYRLTFCPEKEKPLSEVSASYTYFEENDVLLARVTPCFENGKAGIARGLTNGIGFGSSEYFVLRSGQHIVPEWLYYCVTHPLFRDSAIAQMTGTGGLQRVPRAYIENFQIPLPPLKVQQEIVAEIEGYQKVIDGARAVIDNYRPHIPIDPDWPMVEVDAITLEIKAGFASGKSSIGTEGPPHIRPMNVTEDGQFTWKGMKRIGEEEYQGREHYTLIPGDVLFNNTNSRELVGKTCLITEYIRGGFSNHMTRIRVAEEHSDARFLASSLHAAWRRGEFLERANRWVGQAGINTKSLRQFRIPLPSLESQRAIVAEIEAEQALVAANRELMQRMEDKIRQTIERVWNQRA